MESGSDGIVSQTPDGPMASKDERKAYYKELSRAAEGDVGAMGDQASTSACTSSALKAPLPEGCVVANTPEGQLIFKNKAEKRAYFKAQAEKLLPEPHGAYRSFMKDIWVGGVEKEERLDILRDIVSQIIAPAENPYEMALDLHRFACDYTTNKENSLAGRILGFLEEWVNKRDDGDELAVRMLTNDVKMKAFRIATLHHTGCLGKVARIFRLINDIDLEEFIVEEIEQLCKRQKYKEVMDVVALWKWQTRYDDLEKFLIPCLLQNKNSLVEEYLHCSSDLQLKYIRWLDDLLLLSRSGLEDLFQRYVEKRIMVIPFEYFIDKTLERTIRRLLSVYKFGAACAPNFCRSRTQGLIRYQIATQFGEMENTETEPRVKFVDALLGIVGDDISLQNYLVRTLCIKGHTEEALWWCVYLSIPEYNFPREVSRMVATNPQALRVAKEKVDDFRHNQHLHPAENIPTELHSEYNIVIVDGKNLDAFKCLIDELSTEKRMGIDAEWKQGIAVDEVALMQIACSTAVYLVDFIGLMRVLKVTEWRTFLEALLCGPALKFGFDFGQDIKHIFDTFPSLSDIKDRMNGIACLKLLTDNILNQDDSVVDIFDPSRPHLVTTFKSESGDEVVERNFSLAFLYKQTVGKELDKTQQTSDWTKRPLRPEQVVYAAKDAYCLLEIYYELQSRVQDKGLDFSSFIVASNPLAPREKKKKEKKDKADDVEELRALMQEMNDVVVDSTDWKRAQQFKVIVGVSLHGLGKHLRRMGVDVLMPASNNEVLKSAVERKSRVVITHGRNYNTMFQAPGLSGRVYAVKVGKDITPTEQTAQIFKDFKVKPTHNDIFSRCMVCNTMAFVLVPGPVLEFVFRFCHEQTSCYAREEDFNLDEWVEKLKHLPPEDYHGVGATVEFIDPPYDMVANCPNGQIDMGGGFVLCDTLTGPIPIAVKNVPVQALTIPGRFFYVCGSCGKVYWDGTHIRHYAQKFDLIVNKIDG